MNTFFIVGFMGCGKSYYGRIWAEAHGLCLYETDSMIEAAEGKTIAAIFEAEGESYFRQKEKEILWSLSGRDNIIVSTGGGTPCFFDNIQWMNEHGTTIYLKASPQLLVQRLLTEKSKRPLIKNIPDNELEQFISERLMVRVPYYEQAAYVMHADEVTPLSLEHLVKK